ncbi:MAG TPA: hypothetical protein VGT81_03875, partial [Casimicrobiaceae bacterium]|nr:hypothetical protein [Casimicrobiaceae bacterium]
MAPGAGAPGDVIAGRDIVVPADAGLGETPAAGRDIVDEADGAAGAAAPTTGRGPVAEADAAAPTAGRDPVAEADAGEAGFGAVIPVALAGGTAPGAAEGAVPAPA